MAINQKSTPQTCLQANWMEVAIPRLRNRLPRDVCFYQADRNFDRELEGKGGLSAALRGLVSVSHVIRDSYNNRII